MPYSKIDNLTFQLKRDQQQKLDYSYSAENGFALPMILIIFLFLTPLIVSLHQVLRYEVSRSSALKQKLQSTFALDNSLALHLSKLAGEDSASSPTFPGEIRATLISSFRSPILALQSLSREPTNSHRVVYYVSQRPHAQQEFSPPDWSRLISGRRDSCTNWEIAQNHKTNWRELTSLKTCTRMERIKTSVFIPGNLLLAEDLSLESDNEDPLQIIVLGTLTLKSTLKLQTKVNQRVELIAAGAISIPQIEASPPLNRQLFITSASADLGIGKIPTEASFCNGDNEDKLLRIHLEAAGRITIGVNKWNDIHNIGCPMTKNPLFWPNLILLGRKLD